jgi:dihydroorotate dehydrogenase (fumarate)
MDLSTTYLGMPLRTPLVPSASPLSEDLDTLKRLEDAGAAAVVLHSLFEEQIRSERHELHHHLTYGTESFAEALTYFPEPDELHHGPEAYLDHLRRAKAALDIPVIASLNGTSVGGWTDYAHRMQQAGADALELNIYTIPTDPDLTGEQVEHSYVDILRAVKTTVTIPVALKLSPFFSSMAHMARRFDAAGANALVLFNRFYQPDIDLETLEVSPHVLLSTPQDLRLPLRWIAILYGHVQADLAATSGIHTAADVLKMLMAGASITMMCSALLQHGPEHLRVVERELRTWMEEREYDSVQQMQGSMSQRHCADPTAFERAHYMRALQSYRPAWW